MQELGFSSEPVFEGVILMPPEAKFPEALNWISSLSIDMVTFVFLKISLVKMTTIKNKKNKCLLT